jgi:hypothetical protein
LDLLPFGENLHFLMQCYLTRSWPRPTSILKAFIDRASETLNTFSTHSGTPVNKARFLEIGAGRDLAVPIALKLLGAGHITAVDIKRLAKLDLVNHAAAVLAEQIGMEVPPFASWAALEEFGVAYRAPHDLESHALIGPVDAFISNSVLEHIPPPALQNVLSASRTFLLKGGLSIHSIDYSDHFARGGAISKSNFLTFEDGEWMAFNSTFQYVNRLRHSEYIAMHERAGLAIIEVETSSEDLPSHVLDNLAERFRSFEPDDLKIMHSRIISRRT